MSEQRRIKIKNWSRFQHYKHRCPPWIKLATDTFQNPDFARLQDASKLLAICIWTLAAKSQDGSVVGDFDYIHRWGFLGTNVTTENLQELESVGFIDYCPQDASKLHTNADSEAEAEAEENYVLSSEPSDGHPGPASPNGAIDRLWRHYLEATGRNPRLVSLTPLRRNKATARWRECARKASGDAERAEALMSYAIDRLAESDWHMGRDPKTGGKKYCDFEKHLFASAEQTERWLSTPQRSAQ